MKTDLLKEAIADADAIKKLAIENAKASLNQAFDSKIKSMLAARLQEEADETEELEEEVEETDEAKKHSSEDEDSKKDSKEDAAEPEDVDEIDINKILAEMEDDEDGKPEMEEPEMEEAKHKEEEEEEEEESEEKDEEEKDDAKENYEEETDEEVDLNDLLKELEMEEGSYEENKDEEEMEEAKDEEGEESKENMHAKMEKMKEEHAAEIAEIKSQAAKLAGKVNETNLINAKLLYLNKILHKHSLNEAQKVKVIAAFDKATTVKEAKIVFESLNEAFVVKTEKSKTNLKESLGFASKAAGNSTKREIITEADVQVARWQKLAGINKTI